MKAKRIVSLMISALFLIAPFASFAQNKSIGVRDLEQMFVNESGYSNSITGFNANDEAAYRVLSLEQRDVIEKTDKITLNVDEKNTWDYNRELFGVQMSWSDKYDTFYRDGELKESFKEYVKKTVPVPVFRWGGYQINHFNYLLNLGPFEQRKATPGITTGMFAGFEGYPAYRMAAIEYLKVMYANNPDAGLVVGLSQFVYTDREVADLCHFLLDPPTTEWGKKRADLGIENPVKIFYWEMGNEVDKYTEEGRTWYIDVVRRQSEIIRSIDPDAKICISCPTAPWGRVSVDEDNDEYWASWHRKVMPKLADVVDAVAFHPYYDGNSSEYNYMFIDTIKNDLDAMTKKLDIRDKDGNPKEFYILGTEGARWSNPNADQPSTVTFEAALSNSHFLNLAFQRPWYVGNMLHDLCNFHLWGYWALKNDDEWLLTPTEKLYAMYQNNIGDKVVGTSWCYEGDEDKEFNIYNPEKFSTVAFRDGKHRLKIFMTNKIAHRDIDIKFNFGEKYKLVEESILTAPNLATFAYNTQCEELTQIITTPKNEDDFAQYHLAPQCVVVLTLETDADLQKIAGDSSNTDDIVQAEELESAFADTVNHWAKNEIAYLAGEGFVTGNVDNNFLPDNYITNAEFASVLCKALKLHTDYRGNVFSDVTQGDWFFGYANALYVEGIKSGQKFDPDGLVNFSEICKMLYRADIARGVLPNTNFSLIPSAYINEMNDTDKKYFSHCITKGYIQRLFENNLLDINGNVTRGQAASIVYRLYNSQ